MEIIGLIASLIGIISAIIWLFGKIQKRYNKNKAINERLVKAKKGKVRKLTDDEKEQVIKDYETKYSKLKKDFNNLKNKSIKPDYKKILNRSIKKLKNYQPEEFHNILINYSKAINKELDENKEILAKMAFMQARVYCIEIDYQNAFSQAEKAVQLNPQNISYLLFYAQRLLEMGRYDDAIIYYNQALNLVHKQEKIDERIIGKCYNDLGNCYDFKGDYDKAIELYQQAKDISIKLNGEMHANTASTYNNIGAAYQQKGNYDKAIKFYQKALKIFQNIYGEQHPSIATSYNNFGNVYDNKKKYDQAIEFYQKALNIQLETFGKQHPDIAMSYNNIGSVYNKKGEYDKAMEFHEKALKIRKNILSELHPDIAQSYNNMAFAYLHKKNINTAIIYIKKAVEIATALNDVANVKFYTESLDYAIKAKDKAQEKE
jgi:tetratricopeptide (TPR) repeat protein